MRLVLIRWYLLRLYVRGLEINLIQYIRRYTAISSILYLFNIFGTQYQYNRNQWNMSINRSMHIPVVECTVIYCRSDFDD